MGNCGGAKPVQRNNSGTTGVRLNSEANKGRPQKNGVGGPE